jgi:hypothetical protein
VPVFIATNILIARNCLCFSFYLFKIFDKFVHGILVVWLFAVARFLSVQLILVFILLSHITWDCRFSFMVSD